MFSNWIKRGIRIEIMDQMHHILLSCNLHYDLQINKIRVLVKDTQYRSFVEVTNY